MSGPTKKPRLRVDTHYWEVQAIGHLQPLLAYLAIKSTAPSAAPLTTIHEHVGVLHTLVLFLITAAISISWSWLVCDRVADPRDGSVAVSAFATFGLPFVVHATQDINPTTRAINGACSGTISGPFRSLSKDAVEVEAGAMLFDEWGGAVASVHQVTLGDPMVGPRVSLEPAEGRLEFHRLHFGEQWQGGIQELLAANRSACPVPAVVAVFKDDGRLFRAAEDVRGLCWWSGGSTIFRQPWADLQWREGFHHLLSSGLSETQQTEVAV